MFREYDIRGRETNEELSPDAVRAIGRGYGEFLRRRAIDTLVVGRDSRATSDELAHALIEGLLSTGRAVIDIGLSTTPMVYWAQYHFKAQGAASVTASHNPPGWNGVKMAVGYSITTNRAEIEELYDIITRDAIEPSTGSVRSADIAADYTADLVTRVKIGHRPRVLVNTGNGTAGFIAPQILREAGCEVVELHTRMDSSFPHYPANPAIVEMMEDTGEHVRAARAAIGIALDADADRLGITDEQGCTIWPDIFMIPAVRDLLTRKPGSKIVFDVKCSQALVDVIRQHGGVPVMCKTGHSFVKETLRQENAELGIEASGHIFIGDGYYGYDDGIFAALRLLELLDQRGETMSQALQDIPHYYSTPVYNAACADQVKYQITEQLVQRFKREGYNVIDISGARVEFGDGWGLVRASSNLPQLVLRFEAKTPERLREIEHMFRTILEEYEAVSRQWETG
jgi:phosphomannomutase / phosphoglucomutase